MFEVLKNLFQSKDNKPVQLSAILMRDECSRLLGEFAEDSLDDCQLLILVWKDKGGRISMVTNESLDGLTATGMLSVASNMIVNGE